MDDRSDSTGLDRPRPHRYREVVLAALRRCDRPMSAQQLYGVLRAESDHIGLSTVYRELHLLTRMHRVGEVRIGSETAYRLSTHDLLVCDDCGRTDELHAPLGTSVELRSFFGTEAAITVHGRCRTCAAMPIGAVGPIRAVSG